MTILCKPELGLIFDGNSKSIILQKFSSIKYIICISYYDHIIARLSKI